MASGLVIPTGTLAARKRSRDGAYITTRKTTDVCLVGQVSSSVSTTKLSSKKETLALFFHFKNVDEQTIRNACHSTAEKIMTVWAKARIPMRLKEHVVWLLKCRLRCLQSVLDVAD